MMISKTFRLEVAHRLPMVPEGHKCSRLHGHSVEVEVFVGGNVNPSTGWIIDFAEIANAWRDVHDQLDHRYLNEVRGLENPTSENLAAWIMATLKPTLNVARIVVRETCTSACYLDAK